MAKQYKLSYKERLKRLENDPAARKGIFEKLLAHLSKGFSMHCFEDLSKEAIEKWCKLYPDEFDEEEIIEAKRRGELSWEKIGHSQASGASLGNSRSWILNMINRYNWKEKVEIDAKHSGEILIQVVDYKGGK